MRRITLIAVLAVVVSACGGIARNVAENVAERVAEESGGVTDVDTGDGEVTVEVQDGETEATIVAGEEDGEFTVEIREDGETTGSGIIGGGDIPDDFPIPIPDGGDVRGVFQTTENGETTTVASVTYPADRWDEIVEFFQNWVDGLPGDTLTAVRDAEGFKNASFYNEDAGIAIDISSAGDTITVTVAKTES